jgi:predicted AAA+ superfamily ATPase
MIDVNVLTAFNPWWTGEKVSESLLGKNRRLILSQINKYLEKRQILLVYGLRRVGKTTLFYQLIDHFLNKKVEPLNILYFSFDEKSATIEEILKLYQEKVLKREFSQKERFFLFFDEIQKREDWQERIKIVYDRYPDMKIFLSGSASVALQKKSKESLAGRVFDFYLKPLNFSEFLEWREVTFNIKKLDLYNDKILPFFLDYLRKGGFPEIVLETDDEIIRNYIKNTVLERIIYKDLPLEFGLKDTELLKTLLEMIIIEPGMIVNFDKLARDLHRSKLTIINYFEYLKYALIVKEVKNLRPGFLVSSRKGRKIYPTNSSFCFAYRDDFYQEKVLQKIAEVATVNFLEALYYFRNSFEVDVVIKSRNEILPIEVKYGQVEEKSIIKFLDKFKMPKGIIVSKDKYHKKNNLKIIPLWRFLLEGI